MRYPSITALDRSFDDVYISPHLDDVAFSCGGRILCERARGRSALVVTVFTAEAGPCRAIPPRVRARVGDMAERRCEDERAMARLGADFLWLDHPEAIFRDRAYHTLYGAFSRFVPSDHEMVGRLAHQVLELVERVRPQRLYCPLGVGQHADHRVVFAAGVRVAEHLARAGARAPDVCFYEDAPYALIPHLVEHRLRDVRARWTGEDVEPRSAWTRAREAYAAMMTLDSVRAAVGSWVLRAATYGFLIMRFARDGRGIRSAPPSLRLAPELCDIGPVFSEKLEVIAAYRSQIAPVLGDVASYARLRLAYSQRLAACAPSADGRRTVPPQGVVERVWRVLST
jgi:LmbE family N-acetylglucosaminyl deacetylase